MDKLREKLDQGFVLCRIIIEVAGRPKEHIENTMKLLMEKIKEEEDTVLTKGQAFKTKEIEIKNEKMYSSYAEIEILMKNVSRIIGFCFDYMPSSIEILEPSDLKTTILDFTELLNELLTKLHNTDMVLKNTRAENKILTDNASALMNNLFIHILSKEPKPLSKISKQMGIPEKQLKPFIENAIKQNFIEQLEDKYLLKK